MKNYSSSSSSSSSPSGGGSMQSTLDESEIYFSTYMSPPSHHHNHRHHHHLHHSSPKHVKKCMVEEAKGLDAVDVDDEATDFILKRHRKLELAKLMSMTPYY